jgi:membrane protein
MIDAKLSLRRTGEVFFRIWEIFKKAELMLLASSLSFSTIFSLVPILAVFISVSHLSGNFWDFAGELRGGFLEYLASGVGNRDLVVQLSLVISKVDPAGMGLLGFLGILITAVRMIYDLDSTIQRIWQEKRRTHLYKRVLIYLVILMATPLAFSVLAGVLDWTQISRFIRLFSTTTSVLLFFGLFICFKFTPPGVIAKRAALAGTLFTYVTLILGKGIYKWVMLNLFNYNKLYGSLAFLPLFLFWLFVLWCLILLGFTLTKAVDDVIKQTATASS